MPHRVRTLAFAVLTGACGLAIGGTGPDAAGVRDAENQWSRAFLSGDTATLDALLDAQYVSVSTTGHARTKAEVLDLSRAFAVAHPGEQSKPLPPTSTIRVIGNAAVVQHHGDSDTSVDVFYFTDGRWRAWYSQHSKLEP